LDYLSPLESIFPGVGSAVLAVLADTQQPLTIRQLAERAGASHPRVGQHVDRFEALGLVQREVVGRSHLVRLTDTAAAQLVRRLVRVREEVVTFMESAAAELDPPATSIVVFGSFARGTARAGSDIDVAIVAPPGRVADDTWSQQVSAWVDAVSDYAGNPVAEIVLGLDDLAPRGSDPLWRDVRREGLVIAGAPLEDLDVAQDLPSEAP
jgi:DNA-binding transcriptional ArsR family regulator